MREFIKRLVDKFKEFNSNTYGMLIVVSWVVLIACLIIKLFGGNWFELGTENTKFIEFCNFVDNTMWLKISLGSIIYLITTLPVLCCILNRPRLDLKLHLLFIPLMVIKTITSWYILWLSFVLDLLIIIILPLIICRFKNWRKVIIANLLVMAFQLLTIGIRNISIDFNDGNTFLQQSIYQIDYYIMVLLFYLYNFKKNGDV